MVAINPLGFEGLTGRTLEELTGVESSLDDLTQSLDTPYWPVSDFTIVATTQPQGVEGTGELGTAIAVVAATPDGLFGTGELGSIALTLTTAVEGVFGTSAVGPVTANPTAVPVGLEALGAIGTFQILGAWLDTPGTGEDWTETADSGEIWTPTPTSSETWN